MEDKLVPYSNVTNIGNGKVLVFAPHPDDEVFGCGGAIIRHVEANDEITVVIVTDGGMGGKKGPSEYDSYAKLRKSESVRAGELLGYGEPIFLDYPDRSLKYGEKLISELCRIIKESNPDILYAPSPHEIHPDHVALSLCAIEAYRRIPEVSIMALYEVGAPLIPNKLLDITDIQNKKILAMRCFESQLKKQDYDRHIIGLNHYRSYTLPNHVESAEAYHVLSREDANSNFLLFYESEYKRRRRIGVRVEDFAKLPLVSVLIRSIGRPSLSEALQSVSLQTYPNIEVIIVSAKRGDHLPTGEWCGNYPIRLCGTGTALKRSQAANCALEAANGDYLIFLDDDDLFDPDHITNLTNTIESSQGALVAYSGVRCIAEDTSKPIEIYNAKYDSVRLLIGNYIPIHAVLFSKKLLEKSCRFDESIDLYEDWDFWIQLSQHSIFVHSDKVTASYRMIDGTGFGIIADKDSAYKARMQVLRKWSNLWTDKQLVDLADTADQKRLLSMKNDKLIQEILAVHGDIEAVQVELKAVQVDRNNLRNEMGKKSEELNSIINSRSWRATKPLRALWGLFRW